MKYSKLGNSSSGKPEPEKNSKSGSKKISKKIGEYIDYEEIKK